MIDYQPVADTDKVTHDQVRAWVAAKPSADLNPSAYATAYLAAVVETLLNHPEWVEYRDKIRLEILTTPTKP